MAVRVVDASALGAILFGEPEALRVTERLEGHHLAAPTLLRYEIGNLAWKKARRAPPLLAQLPRIFSLYAGLAISEVEVAIDADLVNTAVTLGLSVYDTAYLELSRGLAAELVTLDRRLQSLV